MNRLILTISGQIVRENSANLINFWKGFINIQNSIGGIDELKVIAHSWNPEYDELVRSVYNVEFLESERQGSFVKEYMPLLNPIDKFEKGFNREKSTWSKINPNMLLGQVTSKTKSVALLEKLDISDTDFVLSTRWDIGCSGGKEVNSLIFDPSLSNDYLYLAYFPYVDEGYADMWFWGAYKHIKKFENYKDHFLNTLGGNNLYLDDFTKKGWMLSLPLKKNSTRFSQYKKNILSKILSKTQFNLIKEKIPFISNKIEGMNMRIRNVLEAPVITAENSLLINEKTEAVYPIEQSLNIHAILKYFIFENNLREETRFLDINDFENFSNGYMINPIDFCYIIYSHSSFNDCWEMAIGQAIKNLPENCKKIYLISEDSDDTEMNFSKLKYESNIELLTYDSEKKYTDRLIDAFSKVSKEFESVYFVHEDMPLISMVDKIYLNTLLHYLNNSNEFYIKLVDTNYVNSKSTHDSFPYLVKNSGGYSISVQPSLIKLDYMISFLEKFHQDIYGYEQVCTRSNFIFSAVAGGQKIGKYLLCNKYFPHIATAISKGKWCTNEWNEEINHLAKEYSIDLSLRGEC
ncbi:hypothetical protein [Marinomonas sp.]|uniref:hypothetical protein n=1 Tax=Marinomonas sp. TaxID=1904862 RepID=UPI003BAD6D26